MSDYSGNPMNSDQVAEYVQSKRGSNGGNARKEKLSPERRSEIAKQAAAKRWGKKNEPTAIDLVPLEIKPFAIATEIVPPSQPYVIIPAQVAPEPIPAAPEPPKAVQRRRKPMVKEFGKAHSYAEKRLAEALKERAEAMNKVAMLNAEIPSLVQIIKALGMTPNTNGFQDFTALIPNVYPQTINGTTPGSFAPQVVPLQSQPNPIDPALYATNSNPLPGLVPAAANAPIILNTSAGGAMDLDYVPRDEEEPPLPKMGNGWV